MYPDSRNFTTMNPYWGLRDYGSEGLIWGGHADCEHQWEQDLIKKGHHAGETNSGKEGYTKDTGQWSNSQGKYCERCGAWCGSLGLEPTPEEYVAHIVDIFREVWRVLKDDATVWLNMGDSYFGSWGDYVAPNSKKHQYQSETRWRRPGYEEGDYHGRPPTAGCHDTLKKKDLVGIPWRVAFALQEYGFYLRQDIIWSKPNPSPECVKDRCTKSHDYIFLMSKSKKYYFDHEAILEPVSKGTHARLAKNVQEQIVSSRANGGRKTNSHGNIKGNDTKKRKLAERGSGIKHNESFDTAMVIMPQFRNKRSVWEITTQSCKEAHFATFPEALVVPCILAGSKSGDTVLDPFAGSGTTLWVAKRLGRKAVGYELNQEYCEFAAKRIPQMVMDL